MARGQRLTYYKYWYLSSRGSVRRWSGGINWSQGQKSGMDSAAQRVVALNPDGPELMGANSSVGGMAFHPNQFERPSTAIPQPRRIVSNAGLCARANLLLRSHSVAFRS